MSKKERKENGKGGESRERDTGNRCEQGQIIEYGNKDT